MSAIASQITSLTIVYSIVHPGTDQGKHQSSASLAFVCGIPRRPVNSPHKGPVVSIWWRPHGFYSVLLRITHRGRVTPICVDNQDHHWFWSWIVTCSAPSLYLNQCCFRQSYPWEHNLMNFGRNWNIFIQENAFENVLSQMAVILSRPQFVEILEFNQFIRRIYSFSPFIVQWQCGNRILLLFS